VSGSLSLEEPRRRVYRQTAKRIAFRALTSGRPAAQLVHVLRLVPHGNASAGQHHFMGGSLIANPTGTVTAHCGEYIGHGGPWDLADAIIPGSAHAVQSPALSGYYRTHPEAYRELVTGHAASVQRLAARHLEAVEDGNLFATMRVHPDPTFLGLLRAAIDDRGAQLILHDWLAERGFPHADELRSKRWNQGKWTENQLLDLLTKPFASVRRSFSGRTV
jgi:hypothetical protein